MNTAALHTIFEKFNSQNALVIGDVMVDAYYWGDINRQSPEAPVPIVSVTNKEHRLGGAANVALNLLALGANPILCSVVGQDEKGDLFFNLMDENKLDTSGLLKSNDRITTTKTRIISDSKHVVRVDEETEEPINENETNLLFDIIKNKVESGCISVIIFEDYNKGAITEELIQRVIALAKEKNIPTAVDPKKENFFSYTGATLFKPNLKEIREGLQTDKKLTITQEIADAVNELQDKMPCQNVMVTLSEKGVYIASTDESHAIPAHIRNIVDVSGAGDTVISVAALCVAQNLPIKTTAALANLAGGLVCEKVGVVPINVEELKTEAFRLTEE